MVTSLDTECLVRIEQTRQWVRAAIGWPPLATVSRRAVRSRLKQQLRTAIRRMLDAGPVTRVAFPARKQA